MTQHRPSIPTIAAGLFQGRPERLVLSPEVLRPYTLLHLADRGRLVADVIARRPVILLLPPLDVRGMPNSLLVERVRREAPDVVVALVVTDQSLLGIEVVRASRAGAVIIRATQASDLREKLAPYLDGPMLSSSELGELDALLTAYLQATPALAHALLHAGIRVVGRREAASRLAGHFAVSRRTLSRRTRVNRIATPHQFLIWARLLQAGTIAQRGMSSHTAIVRAAGFSSTSAYRLALRRLLGAAHEHDVHRNASAISSPEAVVRAIVASLAARQRDRDV